MIKKFLRRYRNIRSDKKVLLFNFFNLSYAQAACYLLPLIALPYLLRVLSPEKYGLLVYAATLNQYFGIVIDYGFQFSATKDISIFRNDSERMSVIFFSVILLKILFAVLSFIVLVIIIASVNSVRGEWRLYLLAFGSMAAGAIFPRWFFQGVEDMKYVSYFDTAQKTMYTISIFIFVRNSSDYLNVPLMSMISSLICGIVGVYVAMTIYKIHFAIKMRPAIEALREGFQFFLSRLSISIYTFTNTMIIGYLFSMQDVAYYSLAHKLVDAMRNPFDIFNKVVYPYMSFRKDKGFIHKIIRLSSLAGFCVFILVFIFARYILFLFGGAQYASSSLAVLRILSIMVIFISIHVYLGAPLLVVYGHQKYFNYSIIFGLAFYAIAMGSAYLFNILSLQTIAWIAVLIELFILCYRLFYANKVGLIKG